MMWAVHPSFGMLGELPPLEESAGMSVLLVTYYSIFGIRLLPISEVLSEVIYIMQVQHCSDIASVGMRLHRMICIDPCIRRSTPGAHAEHLAMLVSQLHELQARWSLASSGTSCLRAQGMEAKHQLQDKLAGEWLQYLKECAAAYETG